MLDLVLDSGAYSAWKSKESIDLEKYIKYALNYRQYFSHIINLDVIPGDFGRKPSYAEVESSAKKSYENAQYMRSKGLDVMPVYHMGEDLKWLLLMIEEGYDYIGISPANDVSTSTKRQWLDKVYNKITNNQGVPTVKTHGFGVTSLPLLWRYPWTSCDSTSWVQFSGNGMVLVPRSTSQGYTYKTSPYTINISEVSIDRKHHYLFDEHVKKYCDKYFELKGLDPIKLSNHYRARDKANLQFFSDLQKQLATKEYKFKYKKRGFF